MPQKTLLEIIRFRNSDSVGVVTIQCFMILSAILVVAGLLYVTLVIVVIVVHHCLYDRSPEAVPPYVRAALQFDSEGEDSGAEEDKETRRRRHKDKQDNIIEIGDEHDLTPVHSAQATNARKIHALEKFMNVGSKDPDVGRIQ